MYSFLTSFKNGRDLVKIVKGKLGKIGLILENTSKRGQMGNSVKKKKKNLKNTKTEQEKFCPAVPIEKIVFFLDSVFSSCLVRSRKQETAMQSKSRLLPN